MKIFIFISAVAIFTGVIGSPIPESDEREFLIDDIENIFLRVSDAISESNLPLRATLGEAVEFFADIIDTAGDAVSNASETVDQIGSDVANIPVVGPIASGVVGAASPILRAVAGGN